MSTRKRLRPIDRRSGYVLIEALVTLALGAMVLAGIASLVGLMLRAADRTAMSVEETETIGRAMAAVERDIAATARVHRQVEEKQSLVFLGAADELRIAIDRMDRNGSPETVVVRWKSEVSDSGRGTVTRSEAPLVPGQPVPEQFPGGVRIDTGPAVIRFAYFGPAPDGAGEVLTDIWPNPASLPTAVRLGRADPASLSVVRSLRVPIRVETELGCVDPKMGYCNLMPDRKPSEEGDSGTQDGQDHGDTNRENPNQPRQDSRERRP